MHTPSSFSTTANKLESVVVDKSTIDGSPEGRKSEESVADLAIVSSDEDDLVIVDTEEESEEETDDGSEDEEEESSDEEEELDEEEEDEYRERFRILADAMKLKKMAGFFMNPEKPVEVDGFSCGRNIFSQPLAAKTVEDEHAHILADAKSLRKVAGHYYHPEQKVEIEATACARNYFSQLGSAEQEFSGDEDEHRESIMEDAMKLKKMAGFFVNPEKPVEMDGFSCGRNIFSQPFGAAETVDEDERAHILAEAKSLKKVAGYYYHPEHKVEIESTACARNYFSQPGSTKQESFDDEEDESRESILNDAMKLKKMAGFFVNPEKPVEVDGYSCGRNIFSQPFADDADDAVDRAERAHILADAKSLKKVAGYYYHPEHNVEIESTACARNFFGRPGSAEQEASDEDDEYRESVLADAMKLKKMAGFFVNPEKPVEMDGFSCGRNIFSQPFAAETVEDESAQILADAKSLKKVAGYYYRPENKVEVESTACARNYFSQPGTSEQESFGDEDDEYRESILEDTMKLKKMAGFFVNPEKPVEVDGFSCGRNIFSQPFAAGIVEEDERAHILADAKSLKKVAGYYYHPERKVEIESTACARNYFSLPSTADQESVGDAEACGLAIAKVLPPVVQSKNISSDEEGKLSRSPSSVMLFPVVIDDDHPPLPSM